MGPQSTTIGCFGSIHGRCRGGGVPPWGSGVAPAGLGVASRVPSESLRIHCAEHICNTKENIPPSPQTPLPFAFGFLILKSNTGGVRISEFLVYFR